jgi:predicted flap endonuclease-1-like 5' DNA nuclease
MRIEEIEGIGPVHGATLTAAGVATTEALLTRGSSAAGRAELAETTRISGKLILEWVNHVDLMRIDAVGPEYSDLLEAAGVDSPAELAQRNAANLAVTVQEVVAARPGIVRRVPTEAEIAGWIAQAKTLPKVVTHGGGGGPHGTAEPMAAAAAEHEHHDHDHGDHDHQHEHDHEHEHDHGAAGATPPAPTVATLAQPAPTASDGGLWAWIKRLFGAS